MTSYTEASAVISGCRLFRYQLTRAWGDGPRCAFVMLNPSTADGAEDDPTIRRCTGFAKSFGFDGYLVVNLFALRATDPNDMLAHRDPVGLDNDAHIAAALAAAGRVFAAWGGSHKKIIDRAWAVRLLAAKLYVPFEALRLSGRGIPCHPLYMPGDLTPVPYPHPGADS